MMFRDKPRSRLSDRIRGKSGDELLQELRQEFDKDRTSFFDSNPNWGFTPAGSSFPRRHAFDDDIDDVLRSRSHGRSDIRAHLDDLARRHPEFAEHLRSPPGWVSDFHPSGTGGGSSSSGGGHYAGSYGSSGRGDRFFDKGEKTDTPGGNQNPPQEAQQQPPSSHPSEGPQNPQPEATVESEVTKNYNSARPPTGRDSLSSRHNLRSTDPEIGIKGQAAVREDRNQRSMSAPPDGRAQTNSDRPQRFVSKIEINPVNPETGETAASSNSDGSGKPPMAPPKQPQQQQPHQGTPPHQKQSNVRHIPIFVEGRDEPVLPRNVDQDFSIPVQRPPPPPPQQFSAPHPQQQFHPQPNNQQQRKPPHLLQQQQQPAPPPEQKQSRENVQHQQQAPPQSQSQPQAEKKPKFNNDPMYQIELVQTEVNELRKKIEEFKGTSRTDKEYIYLDEMLTRNLIKLDVIETEGKENVRAARKETIKSIQQCITLLESKVPQTPIAQTPSSTNLNTDSNNAMEVDEKNDDKTSNNDSSQQQSNNRVDDKQKIEVDQTNKNKMVLDEQQKPSAEVQQPSVLQNQSATQSTNQKPVVNEKIKNSVSETENPNEIKC